MLLHTLIDFMRTEGEEGREVNHHGKTITVGGKASVNEIDLDNFVNIFINPEYQIPTAAVPAP